MIHPQEKEDRTGGGESLHPWGKAGRAPGHGRRGNSQLLRLFGRSHDFMVEVTRENAASKVVLAAR